jgi:tRNA(Ile)-lysidine synthase
LLVHVNHGLRGADSDADQSYVEALARDLGLPIVAGKASVLDRPGNLEANARTARYDFIRRTCREKGVRRILFAHTADDQVETLLMRIFAGSGISGLKGIPRSGEGGIERPLLGMWREDILRKLASGNLAPGRLDESNLDTRFERNWIRHILIPLLESRYGSGVKRRLYMLGERFRELDELVGGTAERWMKRHVKGDPPVFSRAPFSKLPSVVRAAVLQRLLFRHAGRSPNERLIERLDRLVRAGGPSAMVDAGRGVLLRNRYDLTLVTTKEQSVGNSRFDEAVIEIVDDRPRSLDIPSDPPVRFEITRVSAASTRACLETLPPEVESATACFDTAAVSFPLRIEPLRRGRAVVPFGASGSRKMKEIMIDRKIPRDLRWGRPTLIDASGTLLWVPGVVRSDHAPVTRETRRVLCVTVRPLC